METTGQKRARMETKISKLKMELHAAEGELSQLRNACDHQRFSAGEWYKERGIGNTWYERLNVCNDCGHMWHEQQ